MDLAILEDDTEESKVVEITPIQKFYKDAHILITGGTGFLGKLLIEKLLRSCSDLSNIYLILRSKKEEDISTRLEKIFEDVLFDRLKRQYPKFRCKVIGIAGDFTLPNMGLSSEDRKLLQDNVNIIFHVGETVTLDEKLKTATVINVQATKDMLQLAREAQNLKSFIYLSTAYSNCIEKVIEEKIYKSLVSYEALLTISTFPEGLLDKITPALLDTYPNTYTLTKQVAECLISECGKGLPIGILRPSTVVSTYQEPVSGWVNNMNGATGIIAGVSLGLIRVAYTDSTTMVNIVPADMVVNSLIAACWEIGVAYQENSQSEMKIYNYESNMTNPITWGYIENKIYEKGRESASVQAVWHPNVIPYKCYYNMRLMMFPLHTVPAYLMDAVSICIGKKQKMVELYAKIHKVMETGRCFCSKEFSLKSKNIAGLLSNMSLRDREIFFCDLSAFSWGEYFTTYFKGMRVYLLNDPLDSLKEGLARARRLYWYHQISKAVLGILLLIVLWKLVQCIFLK